MSEPIPESIPTSADPRSKRPTKKRALSPRSQTASAITTLFSKPDQEIRIPGSTSLTSHSNPNGGPPEIVQNVQGSSAGAGSGEFHVYKASRRREYERLRGMDEEVRKEEEGAQWEREKKEREERDREKTRKNREKRERLKRKKGGNKGSEGNEQGAGTGGKVKPRVIIREGAERLGGEGNGDEEMGGTAVEEEKGVIIHDDD
ncbi:hypothetical protein ONS95_005622 [Cadophora gregata]|uniref:uncharacterized protein n=1 Tax=Cadophora gregata TaxID=51156 RepID=UPI0026DCCDB2|nr:uncharacterized protein ONS95_005622 [Cadophora gregata]KAK0103611.1 hypothetical protein ONS95_005622 [Cadophora gregata]KAK0107802.1 hypothetical protein ONS96_003594 [Cadophora gregata f. sp. sojae]